ncbi:MAG TPA: FimV/HubP family polar landmark protein [Steroidobacteraceae bacterium]|nr:FimV/HubP family polar landmark protein [Steroidobacteraceae bacterium]
MFVRNLPGLKLSALVSFVLALPALVLLPSNAQALGLGDIHLKSTLDAPLSADIDVVDANADDLSTLKASLASRDTFLHFGADYPSFLGTLTFTAQRSADGRAVIHVSSSGVADEPFATLLVEADWARGHVVREYTVLLDPPVFNSKTPSNAAVAAPQVDSGARSGSIDHPEAAAAAAVPGSSAAAFPSGAGDSAQTAPASAAPPTHGSASALRASAASSGAPAAHKHRAPAAKAAAPSAAAAAASTAKPSGGEKDAGTAGGTYTVHAGDTLSTIATQTYTPSNRRARDQALVAIFRANPTAFAGKNMNALRAGSVLNLPGDDELTTVGPGEASTEVRSQYDAWRTARGGSAASGPSAGSVQASAGAAGQLRLVAPQEAAQEAASGSSTSAADGAGAGSGAGNAGTASNAKLQQRVQQLQSQLVESQRLLQLKSSQLADMQARLAQQSGAAAAPTTPAAPPASVAAPSPPVATPSAPLAGPTAPPTPAANTNAPLPATVPAASPQASTPAAVAAPVHPPVRRPVTTVHPKAKPAPSRSVLGLLGQYWYVLALLVLVLIGFVAMRARRARSEDAFDRSLGRLSPEIEPDVANQPRTDTMPVRTMTAAREEPSYSVEESGTHQRPVFDEPVPAGESGGQRVAIDEGMTGEVPVALDQGDPLAEADFHMAYGLYDQAAELVQNAIAREPQRRDLKLKLLEVFFVWGNKERFLQSAHELANTRSQAPAGEWEKIVIMGRQIAPEDALFADGRAVAGAAIAGVDLNLEGGQNRVDFDLLGEPSLAAAAPDGAVDLDLGTALGHTDPDRTHNRLGQADTTGQAHALGSSVDFDLDGPPLSTDATGSTLKMPGGANGIATTREMPAVPAAARGVGDTTRVAVGSAEPAGDAPTVEQPQLHQDDNATIRQKLDAAARNGMLTGEQTAELAIDDLGLDLSGLEAPPEDSVMANSADAPTMLAEVDPNSRQRLARAETERAQSGGTTQVRASSNGQMRATGTWMFTDTDFAKMAPVKGPGADATQQAKTELVTQIAEQPHIDTSSTSRLAALDTADLDLDLSSLGGLNDQPAGAVDLDVGTSAHAQERPAPNGHDENLPDLEPVTLSEVGTKLDLARAYMDMGDPEGARSILSEVLSEGSLSQKQEARRLMDALPG